MQEVTWHVDFLPTHILVENMFVLNSTELVSCYLFPTDPVVQSLSLLTIDCDIIKILKNGVGFVKWTVYPRKSNGLKLESFDFLQKKSESKAGFKLEQKLESQLNQT